MNSKADLHVHSRFSTSPPEWVLRRIKFPDSNSEPEELYRSLKHNGMDFVTLTDHDTIDGCLELAAAHPDDVFISEEVTTFFPDDRCQIHILVWGIDESQHRAIEGVRDDIMAFASWLREEGVAHSVAHPLRSYDAQFSPVHFQKLLLLFKHFETVDGRYDGLYRTGLEFILENLTPDILESLAARHGITPTDPEPWIKHAVGGSNDHAGLRPGIAYTETPWADNPGGFVRCLLDGRCAVGGATGGPIPASHGFYQTGFKFIRQAVGRSQSPTVTLLDKVFTRFIEGRNPAQLSAKEKFEVFTQAVVSGKFFELAKSGNNPFVKELTGYITKEEFQRFIDEELSKESGRERRAFLLANLFTNHIAFHTIESFMKRIGRGEYIECAQQVGGLIPLAIALTPYFYAFHTQSAPQKLLRAVSRETVGRIPRALRNENRAWFTDTLYDVNGVSMTIRKMAGEAVADGRKLTVVTCASEGGIQGLPIANFAPIGEFELPEYEMQKICFPPSLQILDYIQSERFTELILSTPGPLGLLGLMIGKLLGVRISAIYHTDFPKYVSILTRDSFLESLAWQFMKWFYDQCDLIYVNSEYYRRQWIDHGIAPEKLEILPRGLDTGMFHPSRRDKEFWKPFGVPEDAPVILYAGRISKEKNLPFLADVWLELERDGIPARLAFVGDGPYLKELKRILPNAIFTGYKKGPGLASAYASSDFFVFPSTTDTYGNVVVEAAASGIPSIVSDLGGPRDLVADGETGIVTRALDHASLREAILTLLRDPDRRHAMGTAARTSVEDRNWSNAFAKFWARSAEDA